MKKTILFLALFFLPKLMAQQAAVSSGGNVSSTAGSSSYTIGQIAFSNFSGTNGKITQGVQQPFEIVTLGTDEFPEISLTMKLYPNPTTAWIILSVPDYTDVMSYQLFDVNGRQINSQKITQQETQITLENLASSIYLLQVSANNKVLKTFKIIKA